ncbi:endo-1,4-beta-xylanase [Natronoflexus pectinivorans]|uniref:Beta-xylanase n=1 Tax=Natronoflexus pectinivorans TaxID=682526 RepID=A0A4V2RWV4_9BACT|nr:endo-1,4-beta-xylanase [Natronoflexus pectinivorans]TCO10381.1 endo-1,4-beta-xylanase [Natronoflexus pectinivorans]
MKTLRKLATIAFAIILMGSCTAQEEATTLKDALKDYFYIGTALNVPQVAGQDPQAIEIVKTHFNSVVAENCMKMMYLQPEEGVFFWDEADAFIEFAEANDMQIIGHTLVWHSQAPRWMFVDENGDEVSRERLIERMKTHVQTVVERYKGRVHGWDVVNETILDDGSWRQSPWVRIIGPEFVQMAFEFAHEIDPDVELYYNDYSVSRPEKRDGIYNMVKDLIDNGVKIDAVGLQGHLSMDFPTVEMKEEALQKLASLGVKVMVTELDITVLPWPSRRHSAEVSLNYEISDEYNPYPNGLTEEAYTALMDKYVDFFEMFMRNKDIISRVTVWGVDDNQSWRNNWPIRGRTDYPLLFDRDYQPKSAVTRIIELANAKKQ